MFSVNQKLIATFGLVCTVLSAYATDFHWIGDSSNWLQWGSADQWTADGSPATRSPNGEGDYLWPYATSGSVIGRFDLGAASYTIGGYTPETTETPWKMTELHLTNGTLTVLNAKVTTKQNSGTIAYYLWDGATLNYGGPTNGGDPSPIGGNGLYEKWFVKLGATMVANDYLNFWNVQIDVAEGGALTLGGKFRLCNNCVASKPVTLFNRGTLDLPNGLDWTSGDGYSSASLAKVFTLTQSAGELRLGGDFVKTGEELDNHAAKMSFVFAGGKIVVGDGKQVAFRNATTRCGTETFAEVSANAVVAVEVPENSSLDMGLFTYGAGASMTKTGAGILKLREIPAALVVSAGEVSFSSTNASLDNVTFADGSKVVLNAPGSFLPNLANVDAVDFALGENFPKWGVIVTGCDPLVASKIAAKIVVPESHSTSTVVAEGDTVYLKLPLTVVACSFSVPTGAVAAGCGYKVQGLQDGDCADVVAGTPIYQFGDYTTTSEAGTYQVTVSGLSSAKYTITYSPGTIWAFDAPQTPDVFYWAATGNVSADYTDLANWKMDKALTQAATRLPCAADRIYGFGSQIGGVNYIGTMDLQNGEYTVGGYSSGSGAGEEWKTHELHLTNGTLTIVNALNPRATSGSSTISYVLWNDATLYYGGPTNDGDSARIGGNGLYEKWFVNSGAMMVANDYLNFRTAQINVAEGGVLTLGGEFRLCNSCVGTKPVTLVNSGTLNLPNGLDWTSGDGFSSASLAKVFTLTQSAGELRLGGDFVKTGEELDNHAAKMSFVFAGGKIVVEDGKQVAFRNATTRCGTETFAEVSAGAAVAVEVPESSSLDMGLFTYGEGASMMKTGAGKLVLAAARPLALAIEAGALEMTVEQTDLSGVTFANGTTFVFGAKDNEFSSIDNAANMNFTLDPTKIKKKDVLMTSSDPALLETVKDNFIVPADLADKYEVSIDGTSLRFQRKPTGIVLIVR